MKHCIDMQAIISVSHNCSLLSLTCNWRRTITNIPPRSYPPTPSLPHDSDHAECGGVLCLHGSTPFQYFRARLSRSIGQNFGSKFSPKPQIEFRSDFQASWETPILSPMTILKNFCRADWGKNPPNQKLSGRIPLERLKIRRRYSFGQLYLSTSMGGWSSDFFPPKLYFWGIFKNSDPKNVPPSVGHFTRKPYCESIPKLEWQWTSKQRVS